MAGDSNVLVQYNGGDLRITAILFLILTGLSVGLRTYVRGFMTNSFQADDWLMLVAQANFVVSCIFILIGVEGYGLGHHNQALPQWEEIQALKWQALATASYISNMMLIKMSIGVFLLRLAVQKRYKWISYVSMAVVLLWSTALFFWDIFQCKPVAAQWDYTIPNYTCVSAQEVVTAAYALSVLNIITDWLYALLPIPMIWKVAMTPQAKVTVVTILGLGIFASVATLVRVKFLAQLTDTSDILFAGTNAMVWTLVEPGVAIVASSLVTIRPLLRQMRLKGFDSSERSRSRGFWGRHGGGRSSGLSGGNNVGGGSIGGLNSTSRGPWSQMPGDESLRLKDLEAAYSGSSGLGGRGGPDGKVETKGSLSRGNTTLASRGSTQTQGQGEIWGGTVGIALRENCAQEKKKDEQAALRSSGYGAGIGVAYTKDDSSGGDISPVVSTTTHHTGHGGLVRAVPWDGSSSKGFVVIEGTGSLTLTPPNGAGTTGLGGTAPVVTATTTTMTTKMMTSGDKATTGPATWWVESPQNLRSLKDSKD